MTAKENEVRIQRVFKAAPEAVFKAWTDSEVLLNWFAPNDCSLTIKKFSARQGERFLMAVHNPTFGDCWTCGEFLEVTPSTKLVYNWEMCDADGKVITPAQANHDSEWPAMTVVTVTFKAAPGGGTEMTLHQTVSEELAKRTGAYPSWLQMFDRLAHKLEH